MVAKAARFQARADWLALACEAVAAFVRQVGENEPHTSFHTAFQDREDLTRFTHYFAFRDAAAEEFHASTPWVKESPTCCPRSRWPACPSPTIDWSRRQGHA